MARMVAGSVHVLFALALAMLVYRTARVEPYLVAALVGTFPDVDIFLFNYVVPGYHGPLLIHRGITHSLFAAVAVTALLSNFYWRAAAVGYASHIAFDLVTGGVHLFAPVYTGLYGVSLGWYVTNGAVGLFAIATLLSGLFVLSTEDESSRSPGPAPDIRFSDLLRHR